MTENMRRILITGGAGFIGSHVVEKLQAQQYTLAVLDNLSVGKKSFLPPASPAFTFYYGDILDQDFLNSVFSDFKPETVIHLAAMHHIPSCEANPVQTVNVNVNGTVNLLEASGKSGVEKFIFASTGAVYDFGESILREDSGKVNPNGIYAVSKSTGEQLTAYYAAKENFKAINCRLFNAIGRRETNAHLVPDILQQVREGKNEIALGNLYPKRSYVHVEDLAEALISLLAFTPSGDSEIINIGSAEEHSVTDIVNLLSEVSHRPLQAKQDPERIRKSDREHQLADISKIKKLTGWEPRFTLRDALSDAYRELIHA